MGDLPAPFSPSDVAGTPNGTMYELPDGSLLTVERNWKSRSFLGYAWRQREFWGGDFAGIPPACRGNGIDPAEQV